MQNFAKRSLTGANIFALKKKYVCGSISCQQKPSQCFRTKKNLLFTISPQFYRPNKRKGKKRNTQITNNAIKYFCPRVKLRQSVHFIHTFNFPLQPGIDIIDQYQSVIIIRTDLGYDRQGPIFLNILINVCNFYYRGNVW